MMASIYKWTAWVKSSGRWVPAAVATTKVDLRRKMGRMGGMRGAKVTAYGKTPPGVPSWESPGAQPNPNLPRNRWVSGKLRVTSSGKIQMKVPASALRRGNPGRKQKLPTPAELKRIYPDLSGLLKGLYKPRTTSKRGRR